MTDGRIRIDKWLWHARFYRSRTQAQQEPTRAVDATFVDAAKLARLCATAFEGGASDLVLAEGRVVSTKLNGERRCPAG